MDKKTVVKQLNKGFAYLTEREKLVLTLAYFEELSEEEIGYVLNLHLHTVSIELAQAKTKMRSFTTIFDDIDEIGRKSLKMLKNNPS